MKIRIKTAEENFPQYLQNLELDHAIICPVRDVSKKERNESEGGDAFIRIIPNPHDCP